MIKFFRSAEPRKTILFVCVENAARSQMAEGFFRVHAPEGYQAMSAGTKPVAEINPLAIEAMGEVGIDITRRQRSKVVTEDMKQNSNQIVNMGCMEKESCPRLFLNNVIEWNIEDPKEKSIEKVREIRDEIKRRVKELVASLKARQQINV
jgi:arsenate reductase (thioredoxin)